MKSRQLLIVLQVIVISVVLQSSCTSETSNQTAPEISSNWWQLTTTYPDISPYKYTPGDNKVCDFTLFQAADSTWQLIACIRGNDYPGSSRFLYLWEARSLSDTLWEEKGVFLSTGTKNENDKWGNSFDSIRYQSVGLLQAPHCIVEDGKYYLFYNNDNAHCMVSEDGKNWEHIKNDNGSWEFFEMGRDLMIFDDRENSGNWIVYYTTGGNYPQYVAARTSKTLSGEWSDEMMVYDGYSNTRHPIYRNEFAESPFVIEDEGLYYLFAQMQVFVSDDPLDFTENKKVAMLESSVYEERVWAPEIIIGNDGKKHIAAYRTSGIWICEMQFSDTSEQVY
jgi:hypothetical protein